MKNWVCIWMVISLMGISIMGYGCASSQRTYEGAAVGGAVGAVAGALLDKHNRWRGAMIGGALGATIGGATTEIADRAAREAAQSGRPVAYQSTDGWQRVEAQPVSYNQQTKCHKVQEKIYQDGRLIKDEIREVCEGTKTDRTY